VSEPTSILPPFNCLDAGRDRHCLHYEEGDGDCCICGKKLPPSCEECGGFETADPRFEDCVCTCPRKAHGEADATQEVES